MLPPPQPNGFPVPILGLKMHESPGTRGVARHCDVIPLSRHATSERQITLEVRPSRAAAAHHSAHATATPPSDGG